MAWQFHRRSPVFLQIVRHIRADVLNGRYAPDEQIPSVRQLAVEASVNPNTMQRALSILEEEGILCARGTVGRFVTTDEEVLERARESAKREALADLFAEARELGITDDEILHYIEGGKS